MKASRAAAFLLFALSIALSASEPVAVKIRDLTSVEGVRENSLIGYGMVVGLTQTGDSQQTVFTTQTLANIMQRMGAQIPPATAIVKDVAAVFVTASLPAFARPGMQVDVTVSAVGDSKSLEGGVRFSYSAVRRGRPGLCRRPRPDRGRWVCRWRPGRDQADE